MYKMYVDICKYEKNIDIKNIYKKFLIIVVGCCGLDIVRRWNVCEATLIPYLHLVNFFLFRTSLIILHNIYI